MRLQNCGNRASGSYINATKMILLYWFSLGFLTFPVRPGQGPLQTRLVGPHTSILNDPCLQKFFFRKWAIMRSSRAKGRILTGCEFEIGFFQSPLEMAAMVGLFSQINTLLQYKEKAASANACICTFMNNALILSISLALQLNFI